MNALEVFAGPTALRHLRTHGLRAQDVAVIPAAAGGVAAWQRAIAESERLRDEFAALVSGGQPIAAQPL